MMHDPCFEGFITHRFTDATIPPHKDTRALVEEFKRNNPGGPCERLGLTFISREACKRRMVRKQSESDLMYDVRTTHCRECQGAK